MSEPKKQVDYKALIAASLKCRCPSCLEGNIFDGFLGLKEACPHCGLSLQDHDSGDGPAVFLIFVLGSLIVPIALWVAMVVEWSLLTHTIIWSSLTLLGTVGMLRPAKALTVAMQYYTRGDIMQGKQGQTETDQKSEHEQH